MPLDPMESAEQAEAEADEKFFEEREDEAKPEHEREKGDDDGVEYADPSDELAERRFDALFDWFIEGPK